MKIILLLALQFLEPDSKDSSKQEIITLATEKLVPVFTADTRAHRMSFQKNYDENSYTASMGGIFPIIDINKNKFKGQLSAAGSTYLTLLRQSNSGSVVNTDFFADLFFDMQVSSKWAIRLGTGHTSQHLSDDAIIAGKPFRNYAKDYHQAMAIFRNPKYRLIRYFGLSYIYNYKTSSDISNKVLIQAGFEEQPFKVSRAYLRNIYFAGDIKFRQEIEYKSTINFQLGYRITNSEKRIFRFAYDYTIGVEERGYFQPLQRNFSHLGIYFDF